MRPSRGFWVRAIPLVEALLDWYEVVLANERGELLLAIGSGTLKPPRR